MSRSSLGLLDCVYSAPTLPDLSYQSAPCLAVAATLAFLLFLKQSLVSFIIPSDCNALLQIGL